jgi:pyruvate dehydrogenase E1 component alpha subunit
MELADRAPGDTVRILDPDGEVVGDLPDLTDEELVGLYRDMRLVRQFDERMVSLQRQGRVGTYSPAAGQEASQVASMYALEDRDWVSYQYREHAVPILRGFPPEYVRYWMGHESGNAELVDRNVVPLNVTIADNIPHATGMAWASKLQGDDAVVVCHFGDGATSEGDFHEGLNFAGVFDVPAVFFCNNNGWAISVPTEQQTASETFAQKAEAYGFEGIRVDGMDPLAVYEVSRHVVEKARDPDGDRLRPTLVEAIQYRFGAHTTADDPSAYREEEQVEAWREKDPIARTEAFLRDRGLLDDDRIAAMEDEIDNRVAEVVDDAESMGPGDPDDVFADAFAEQTSRIADQQEYLRVLRERHGDDALTRDE